MNIFEKNQANVPVSGAEARPSETGVVESQNVNISAGQEEHDQATTAASAVEPTATQEQSKTLAAQMQEKYLSDVQRAETLEKLKTNGLLDSNGMPTDTMLVMLSSLSFISGIRQTVKSKFLASELKAAGFVFCFDKENREIHSKHLDELYKSVKDAPSKCFSESGKVVFAKDALAQGRIIVDYDGHPITAATPDLDKYILVIDMQHRLAVIMEHPETDCFVEFIDPQTDIAQYIDNLNNASLKWNGADVKHSLIQGHEGEADLLEAINEFKERFSVTEKFAEIAITHGKDQYRFSDMKKILSGETTFNAEKFKVDSGDEDLARNIMYATLFAFGKEKKVRKIEFIEAVNNIKDTLTDDKAQVFSTNILNFIVNMSDLVKSNVISKIEAKDTTKLNSYMVKQYNTFVEDNAGRMETITQETNAAIEAMKAEVDAKNAQLKPLKTGSIKTIIENRKAVAAADTAKKAAKKAKEAEMAAKKAEKEAKKAEKEAAKDAPATSTASEEIIQE